MLGLATPARPSSSNQNSSKRRPDDRARLVERCQKYLAKCDDAISGAGGHDATFHAACECFRFGLSDAEARNVLQWFNDIKTGTSDPKMHRARWTDSELDHKLADASAKVTSDGDFGCRIDNHAAPLQKQAKIASPDAIMNKAKTANDAFDQTEALAHLPKSEYGKAKVKLKAKFGRALNLKDLESAVAEKRRQFQGQQAVADDPSEQYEQNGRGIVWRKPTGDGTVPVPLTNFGAKIVTDIVHDDGAEQEHFFVVEASLHNRTRTFNVPARFFSSMNWATEHLGAAATIHPGFGVRDHARFAVQTLSGDPPRNVVFAHTGWREIDSQWAFLHAAGAVGPKGPIQIVQTDLEGSLSRYVLPAPPTGADLSAAVRASIACVRVLIEINQAVLTWAPFEYDRESGEPPEWARRAHETDERLLKWWRDAIPALCQCLYPGLVHPSDKAIMWEVDAVIEVLRKEYDDAKQIKTGRKKTPRQSGLDCESATLKHLKDLNWCDGITIREISTSTKRFFGRKRLRLGGYAS